MKKQLYRSRQSPSLMLLVKVAILALAAPALPFLIIYTLPSLNFLLFHVMPRMWSFSCSFFTPIYLFVFLNLIILILLSMAHLHRPAASSPLQLATLDDRLNLNHEGEVVLITPSVSNVIKLDHHEYADLQLVYEVETTDQDGADLQLVNEVENTDQDGAGEDDHVQELLDCSSYGAGADHDDQEDESIMNADLVIKEVITETRLQQKSDKIEDQSAQEEEAVISASDHSIDKEFAGPAGREICRRTADEDKSVEADQHAHIVSSSIDHISSSQGNVNPMINDPLFPFEDKHCNNIDSLLSEEGSIFTRVESRALTSARFTHKKASKLAGAHDRSHSPLRSISRPIVKRGGDTFEATWKAICESKRHSSPFNRHYSKHTKKVDTFEGIIDGVVHTPYYKGSSSSPLSPIKQRSKNTVMHNHELTKAHATTGSRKPSMPQEELNAKVESFISRFNEQMRIQREKSLLDYMEMVGRGTR